MASGVSKAQLVHIEKLLKEKKFEEAKPLVLDILNAHPDFVPGYHYIATIYNALEDYAPHLTALLLLANYETLTNRQRYMLYKLCNLVEIHSFHEKLVNGLLAVLDYEELDPSVSIIINQYLFKKYKINEKEISLNINEVAQDELLIKALPLVLFCTPQSELFLSTIREAILQITLRDNELKNQYIPLVRAIALNNYLNEYVAYIKDSETATITSLKQLIKTEIDKKNWTPTKSEPLLLLLAMYEPFISFEGKEVLLNHPPETWPASLSLIANRTLFDIQKEIDTSQHIETLTEIKDEVSKEVQAHYEENPYPRWHKTSTTPVESLEKLIGYSCPQAINDFPNELSDPKTPIFIAGCGTGKQSISVAKYFPDADILAIDISRRSLAYSKIKSDEMNIKNIQYYHADILELPESIGQFFYIECGGVLHHMADPLAGWRKLTTHLKPGGIMKIAVYSELARKDVTEERIKINQLNLTPTPTNIRRYRKAKLTETKPSNIVKMFSDFYSLSECRDLLFHQHEKCFTWKKIEDATQALGLNLIGLVKHASIHEEFFKLFPEENSLTNFSKLDEFEQKRPYAFRAMYQFFVQKPV